MFHERSETLRHKIRLLREQCELATLAAKRRSDCLNEIAVRSLELHARSRDLMDAVLAVPGGSVPRTAEPPFPAVSQRPTTPRRARPASGHLSARELEVAALVAAGLTNGEIARRLYLTRGTVANHLRHIMKRLGARGRVDVARWYLLRDVAASGA